VADDTSPSRWCRMWRGYLRPMLLTAVVLFAFRSTVIDWNFVPTGSMKPTIVEWDVVLVNKLAYDLKLPFVGKRVCTWDGPARGDIVVFDPPGTKDRYVKRVVGVPGDTLEMRDNRLFVNGRPAEYQLLPGEGADHLEGVEAVAGRTHALMLSREPGGAASFGPTVVPAEHYFVLGDNRDNSADSRYFGFVSREKIAGRVGRVLISLDPVSDFAPRWSRWGQALQ
jgi:signal peptidase I